MGRATLKVKMTTVALLHLFLLIAVASCMQRCPDNVLPIDPEEKDDRIVAECGTREYPRTSGKDLDNPDKQGNQRWPWTVAIFTDRKDGSPSGRRRRIFRTNAVLVPDSSNNDVYNGGGKIIFYNYSLTVGLRLEEPFLIRLYEFDRNKDEHWQANIKTEKYEPRSFLDFQLDAFLPTEDMAIAISKYDSEAKKWDLDKKIIQRCRNNQPCGTPKKKRVDWFPSANVVCLPTCQDMFPAGTRCWVAGFDNTAENKGLQQSQEVPLVDRETCQARLNEAGLTYQLKESEFCAGGEDGQEKVCDFNRGAGLYCESEEGHWTVVGIGTGCNHHQTYEGPTDIPDQVKKAPQIYLKVDSFLNHIIKYPTGTGVDEIDPVVKEPELPTGCIVTRQSDGQNVTCKFPFKFAGGLYYGCTSKTDPDGRVWCSTATDENDNHIGDQNLWGYCEEISTCYRNENLLKDNENALIIDKRIDEITRSDAENDCPCKSVGDPECARLKNLLSDMTNHLDKRLNHPVLVKGKKLLQELNCGSGQFRCCA